MTEFDPLIAGRSVDLLGAGIDNMALLPHLTEASQVRVWVDDVDAVPDHIRQECARYRASVGAVSNWVAESPSPNRLVVRSPGFPRYREDVARALDGTPIQSVTTAINLWLTTFGDRFPTVIITGTKGKSTVARMLAALLPHSELVGNIGTPIWSVQPPPAGTVMVCEVSSYQAVDFTHRADLAILTSLSEDHISWHGSVERYHADKLAAIHQASRVLTIADLDGLVSAHSNAFVVETPDTPDRLSELPAHMASNARLALAAAERLQADFGAVVVRDPAQTLLDLPAMVGRLREIHSQDGHRWFDDSLASNPSGAAAAVAAFADDHLWLILGGIDRKVSPAPLAEALRSSTQSVSIVAVPDNGADLVADLTAADVVIEQQLHAPDVESAVALIRTAARQHSTVLFSPAAPTPPQHGNWSNRSAAFEAAVLSS